MRLHRCVLLDTAKTTTSTTTTTTNSLTNLPSFQSVLQISLDILTNLFEAGSLSNELLSWDYLDYRSSPERLLEEIVFWSQLAIDCKKKLHLRPEAKTAPVRLQILYPFVSCNSFNLMSKLLQLSKYILLSSPLYHMLVPSQLSEATHDDGPTRDDGPVKRKATSTSTSTSTSTATTTTNAPPPPPHHHTHTPSLPHRAIHHAEPKSKASLHTKTKIFMLKETSVLNVNNPSIYDIKI